MDVYGNKNLLHKSLFRVAVVGPRESHHDETAFEIGKAIGRLRPGGIVLASGAAKGVDICAMRGALTMTPEVIGFDYIAMSRRDNSRKHHSEIRECLVQKGGCWVYTVPGLRGSEAPLARNRVMAENVDAVVLLATGTAGSNNMFGVSKRLKLPIATWWEVHDGSVTCQSVEAVGEFVLNAYKAKLTKNLLLTKEKEDHRALNKTYNPPGLSSETVKV